MTLTVFMIGGYRLAAWLDLIANAMSGIASEEYVIEDEL